jgi:hypothetical protein
MIGKSRLSGREPNVRFDEGELEIELLATAPALYFTDSVKFGVGGEIFREVGNSFLLPVNSFKM